MLREFVTLVAAKTLEHLEVLATVTISWRKGLVISLSALGILAYVKRFWRRLVNSAALEMQWVRIPEENIGCLAKLFSKQLRISALVKVLAFFMLD
jgi:hypothetical protein